ncbi:MAG: hypothetical protein ACKVTZ_23830 [Bacteroidia bacterium]
MQLLQDFSLFVHKKASWRNIGIATLVWLLFQVILGYFKSKIDVNVSTPVPLLDFALGHSPQSVYNTILAAYNETALANYKMAEIVDMFYPLSYATLFSLLICKGFNKLTWACLIPFIAIIFDYLENIGIMIMVYGLPKQHLDIALFYLICCHLKWIFAGITIILMLVSLSLWGVKSWKK